MEGDEAAIARARAGDGDPFRELVERHSRVVFRLGYRMTGNEQDAEEAVQETFLHAWRWIGRFESRSGFGTWLYRIAVNCSMDLLRRRSRREAAESDEVLAGLPDDAPGPERLAGSGEVRERVRAAVEELSPLERAAFVLRHFEGLRIEEIARRLDRREDATKNSILGANRLYRQAAATAGENAVAALLEDLERVLLELAHGAADPQGLTLVDMVFKVRATASQVRARELEADRAQGRS